MRMEEAKRVDIVLEAPLLRRLADGLKTLGVSGYTVLPVVAGSGRSGPWNSAGQVSLAADRVAVMCVIEPERADALLEIAFKLIERRKGIVTVTDCQVARPDPA